MLSRAQGREWKPRAVVKRTKHGGLSWNESEQFFCHFSKVLQVVKTKMHTSIGVKCKSNQDLLLFLFFVFQTLRTCLQQFRKNCLMRCWTETYKKVEIFTLFCFMNTYHMLSSSIHALIFSVWERNQIPWWSGCLAHKGSPLTNCIL